MDIPKFRKRIQTTILFTEEQKAYFLARAETYTPEIRDQIIEVLNKHEKNLDERSDEILDKIQEEQSSEIHKHLSLGEKNHNREIKQAMIDLETDIQSLEAEEIMKFKKEKTQIRKEQKKPEISRKAIISLVILTIVLMLSFFVLKNWNFFPEDSQSNESHEGANQDVPKPKPKPKLK